MITAAAVTALTAFTAACSSAPSDSSGGASDDLIINPIGTEHESHLTLQLPTDACSPGATCAKVLGTAPVLYVDGVSVTLGASTRLKPGAHNVAVNNVSGSVTTVANQSLTVTLPVVQRSCVDATLPNVPSTDFGGSVTVSNAACPTIATGATAGVPATPSGEIYYGSTAATSCSAAYAAQATYNCAGAYPYYYYGYETSSGTCVPTGIGLAGCSAAQQSSSPGTFALTDAYEAAPPGTLTASVAGQSQSITLTAGEETAFTLNLPATGTVPGTFATTVTFLDARVNPDAAAATITSSCATDRGYSIPAATGTPAPLALTAFVSPSCTYTLNVAGRPTTLSQTAANAISLHRLDVDDVTITREDGTTYTTKGTYSLNYGGVQVAGPYSTGSGIDVLPGTYQFSLNYTDFDGPQTQTQTVTF